MCRPTCPPTRRSCSCSTARSGTGEQFAATSPAGARRPTSSGLIAVFPTGQRYRITETGRLSTKWADFNLVDDIEETETPPADDVGFVDDMLADIEAGLSVDSHRIYASGFSNGAGFAARLAVDRSETFAAVAFSGGGLNAAHTPARSVPTYATVGTLDQKILERMDPPLADSPSRRSSPRTGCPDGGWCRAAALVRARRPGTGIGPRGSVWGKNDPGPGLRRGGQPLRREPYAPAREYLSLVGVKRITPRAKTLEEERWAAALVRRGGPGVRQAGERRGGEKGLPGGLVGLERGSTSVSVDRDIGARAPLAPIA